MTTLASCSDQEIWNLFRAGNDEAYEQIYRRHSETLLRYGYQISKDRALVEDCVHDIFTYIFLHRATLGETTSIRYYLFKSLRRKIIEVLQRKTKTDQHHLTVYRNQGEYTASFEDSLIEDEITHIRSKNLERVIQDLPPRQQEAIFLLYFSALSYEEIATVMSLSVRTVYNHVHSGLETLRSKMLQPELAQFFLAYLSASLLPLLNTF